MKSYGQLKAGVILSYLQTGISMIISLAYTPLMLRILGQNEYGVYQTAASVISYLGLLSFGFDSSYMRFFSRFKSAEDKGGLKKLNGLFLTVYGTAALVSLAAGLVLTNVPELVFGNNFSASELLLAQKLMFFMVVSISLSFINSVFSMYISANEKFIFQRILSIASTLLNPMITLPLLILGYGSVGLTAVSVILNFASLLCNFFYAKKLGMAFSLKKPDFSLLKEVSVFSFFIFLTTLSGQINSTVDKYLLARLVGSASVSVYEIGSRFNAYLMTFSITVSAVFVPRVNNLVVKRNDNRELSELMTKVGRIQFFILALIMGGFFLVGNYFIGVYAGEQYGQSYNIAMLLMAASFIPYTQNIGIEIQKAKNKHVFRAVTYLAIAICNVIISIPLIYFMGIEGAAIGSAVALIIGNTVLMNFYYKKGIGLDMTYFWKSMLRPVLSVLIAFMPCFILTRFVGVDRLSRFFAVGLLFVALYILAVWFIGANESEKKLVTDSLPLIGRKEK